MEGISYTIMSGVGKRAHNEDSYCVAGAPCIFMVCDGVGGRISGEIAGGLCCDAFENFFLQRSIEHPGPEDIREALLFTEQCFSDYVEEHPEAEGMATTLALLSIHDNKALVAHVGDSRIYHIRNGEILYVTTDHSLVAEWVASGYISENEARNHPRRNEISRAIQGGAHPTEASIFNLDLQDGDYFLLCTDGVLESVSDEFLRNKFQSGAQVDQVLDEIEKRCRRFSTDNYTAIGIRVASPPRIGRNEVYESREQIPHPRKKKSQLLWTLTLLITTAAFFYWLGGKQSRAMPTVVQYEDTNKTARPKVNSNGKNSVPSKEEINSVQIPAKSKIDSLKFGTFKDRPVMVMIKKSSFVRNPIHTKKSPDSSAAVLPGEDSAGKRLKITPAIQPKMQDTILLIRKDSTVKGVQKDST